MKRKILRRSSAGRPGKGVNFGESTSGCGSEDSDARVAYDACSSTVGWAGAESSLRMGSSLAVAASGSSLKVSNDAFSSWTSFDEERSLIRRRDIAVSFLELSLVIVAATGCGSAGIASSIRVCGRT